MIMDKNSGHNLARKTELRRTMRRIGRGASKVKTDAGKRCGLLLAWVLLAVLWCSHGLANGLLMGGFLGRLYCTATGLAAVALAMGLTTALFWAWGAPWHPRRVEENLARIGFTNANGEVPELLSKTKDKDNRKIAVLEFEICGIPVGVWLDCNEKIQSALDVTILDVQYGQDNQHIKVTVAPPASTLPTMIVWTPARLPLERYVLALGEDCAGRQVTWDLRQGHAILAGMTGSGKSVALRCLLHQCRAWGAEPIIVDLKGGVGFSRWSNKCRVVTSIEALLPVLDELSAEIAHREEMLSKHHYQDVDEYNQRPRAHRMNHIVLAVDEAAELFDKVGASKAQKAMVEQVERHIASIARKGRTAGVHLLLSTQRPDANTLPPQVKANVSMACCGMANKVLSEIVLDSTAAADLIPRGARGRFVISQGADTYTVFQAYYFDEWRLKYD